MNPTKESTLTSSLGLACLVHEWVGEYTKRLSILEAFGGYDKQANYTWLENEVSFWYNNIPIIAESIGIKLSPSRHFRITREFLGYIFSSAYYKEPYRTGRYQPAPKDEQIPLSKVAEMSNDYLDRIIERHEKIASEVAVEKLIELIRSKK